MAGVDRPAARKGSRPATFTPGDGSGAVSRASAQYAWAAEGGNRRKIYRAIPVADTGGPRRSDFGNTSIADRAEVEEWPMRAIRVSMDASTRPTMAPEGRPMAMAASEVYLVRFKSTGLEKAISVYITYARYIGVEGGS